MDVEETVTLHSAIRSKDSSILDKLLNDSKHDVNIVDLNNDTPLHIATDVGSVDILQRLLMKGALVNVKNKQGETPLHLAARSTCSAMVERLLENGASMNVYNKEGFTPFHIAVAKGYKKVIEIMLYRGAKVNSMAVKNQSPLHLAANHWNCILAEILLDRGGEINARDFKGRTPLHVAVSQVDMTMLELLLERGADVNAADNKGQTPLHLAADHWNHRIVKILLNRGSLINVQTNKGQTALHIAVKNGDLTLVKLLLDSNALTDVMDSEGLTPLHYAVSNYYQRLVLKLLSKGADMDVLSVRSAGCSPIIEPLILNYMVRLQIAGMSEFHQFHQIIKDSEFTELTGMCVEELNRIKDKKLTDMSGDEYSLGDLLIGHRNLDASTYKLFESELNSPDFKFQFPLYGFIIKVSLLRITQRQTFLRKSRAFFILLKHFYSDMENKPFPILTLFPIKQILSQLSNVDLQNLIAVVENIIRSKIHQKV